MSKETNQRLLDKLQQDLASAGAMPLYLRFNASLRQAIEQGLLNSGDFSAQRTPVHRTARHLAHHGAQSAGLPRAGRHHRPLARLRHLYSTATARAEAVLFIGGRQRILARGDTARGAGRTRNGSAANGCPPALNWLKSSSWRPVRRSTNSNAFTLIDRRPMSVAVSYVVVTAIANVDEIGISLYDYFRRNKVEMGSLRSQGQRGDGRRRYPSGAAALGADAAVDRAPDAVRPP